MWKMENSPGKALQYLLNDNRIDYQSLLSESGFDTLHLRKMKAIAWEVLKSIIQLNPKFTREMFHINLWFKKYDCSSSTKVSMAQY